MEILLILALGVITSMAFWVNELHNRLATLENQIDAVEAAHVVHVNMSVDVDQAIIGRLADVIETLNAHTALANKTRIRIKEALNRRIESEASEL